MTTTPPPSPPPGPAQAPAGPLIMHGQYIKDLSFENPRAPQSLIEQTQPQLSLNVQVTNRQFDAKTFEVALSIEANAKTAKDEPLFMQPPRRLSPSARAVVANATREAGFPPLNIAPVDFVALYRQQLEANGGKMPGVTPGGPVGHA